MIIDDIKKISGLFEYSAFDYARWSSHAIDILQSQHGMNRIDCTKSLHAHTSALVRCDSYVNSFFKLWLRAKHTELAFGAGVACAFSPFLIRTSLLKCFLKISRNLARLFGVFYI